MDTDTDTEVMAINRDVTDCRVSSYQPHGLICRLLCLPVLSVVEAFARALVYSRVGGLDGEMIG
jgi:hypothetical protein